MRYLPPIIKACGPCRKCKAIEMQGASGSIRSDFEGMIPGYSSDSTAQNLLEAPTGPCRDLGLFAVFKFQRCWYRPVSSSTPQKRTLLQATARRELWLSSSCRIRPVQSGSKASSSSSRKAREETVVQSRAANTRSYFANQNSSAAVLSNMLTCWTQGSMKT